MNDTKKLTAMRDYVYNLFHDDATGHDFCHMERVARMAKTIAVKEGANLFICESVAWLHDVGDKKLVASPEQARNDMDLFLSSSGREDPFLKE